MSTDSSDSDSLPGLPTELLIRIFSHLQVEDLLSVQHTCRRFCDVISGSASLQYFLRTKINLLEDLLPSDFSLRDRVSLLKHHETAWDNLELNEFTRFLTCEESHARCYILQDGYLIYKAVTNTAQYGYLDLYSSSAQPNAELRWAHIPLATSRPLSDIVFAVDHNLVVAMRCGQNGHATEASFLEFTTGSCHPLALAHTVSLPVHPVFDCRKPEVEVLGDYILVTAVHEVLGHSTFSVISWKTGRVTQLYHVVGALRVVIIDPDDSLIALIQCATNCIELCKLQFVYRQPCLHSLCFLMLPIFKSTNPTSVFTSGVEWIPTSKRQDRTGSQTSRGRPFPFRSHRAGTIGLVFSFRTRDKGVSQYAMFISVEALLSAVQSGVRDVPWVHAFSLLEMAFCQDRLALSGSQITRLW
ncbi:hypothetical protein EDB86DRAFT_2971167 [Lactarius hatsudake]|nr:hypothetical protein EDB86DRAFT_2971167 [Lactarius hatsudake]